MLDKMNPRVKELWVNALRSGEYEQGQGYLEAVDEDNVHKWCCLGVLTDLAIKDGVEGITRDDTHGYVKYWEEVERSDEFEEGRSDANDELMYCVQKWAGLHHRNPDLGPEIDLTAIQANDEEHFDFNAIADAIEKNL